MVWCCMRRFLVTLFCALMIFGFNGTASGSGEPEYTRLLTELRTEMHNAAGKYGLYLIDMESGKHLGINEDEVFHAASTVKVPINLYLVHKFVSGEINPSEYLTYQAAHYEGGTGYLHTHSLGTRYQVGRLSRDSIVYSDNVATNILLSKLGRIPVKDFMRSLGAEAVDDNRNITSPKDMAIVMEALVLFADQYPAEGGLLLAYMRRSAFRDGIPSGVPPPVPVANKIGFWPKTGTYNDVAYVEHPQRPYVLAMYSEGTPGGEAAYQNIRRLTSIVHSFQDHPDRVVNLIWNGESPVLAEKPVLRRSVRVEVPVRALCSAMPELNLHWNPEIREIIISSTLTGGESSLAVNGGSGSIVDGRFYAPIRRLLEDLGYLVEWSANDFTITVTGPIITPPDVDQDLADGQEPDVDAHSDPQPYTIA